MAWIDTIALWIGYVIMAAMGMGVAAFAVGLALEALLDNVFRRVRAGMNLNELRHAVAEWRKAHPDRAERFDNRKD